MRSSRQHQLRCAAYHEAGHAVAGIALGRSLIDVNVKWHRDSFVGSTNFNRHPSFLLGNARASNRWQVWVLEREIMIAWAGFTSEQLKRLRSRLDGTELSDAYYIRHLLKRLSPDQNLQDDLGASLRDETIVVLKKNWAAVEHVAKRLEQEHRASGAFVRLEIFKLSTRKLKR